jgi:ATP sulfurylase
MGCNQKQSSSIAGEDASNQDAYIDASSNDDDVTTDDKPAIQTTTKIIEEDDQTKIVATGRAKKGRDVSLSRQMAANRARQKLKAFLEKKGYLKDADQNVANITIEKYYTKNKFIYAQAVYKLSENSVNQSIPISSKLSDDN